MTDQSATTQIRTNDEFFRALEKLTAHTELLEAQVERAPDQVERHPLMHFDVWFIIAALCTGIAITHSSMSGEWVERFWFVQTACIIAALITNLSRPRAITVVHNFHLSRLHPAKKPKKSLVEIQKAHGIRPYSNVYRGKFPLDPAVDGQNAG